MTTEKEKGATPFESAPQAETYAADSTAPAHKRGEYGRIAPELLAWLALLAVVLLAGACNE